MALGTAGFTAALGVVRMEANGLAPANGPVIVSGATGGVGTLAIDMLAGLGYHVVALTGKEAETEYLKGLGAKEVMLRQSLDLAKIQPLDKALWAGAVDNLGGDVLAWIASTMTGRHHRQHRPGGEPDAQHHRAAVHPARGLPARHRFRLHADALAPAGLAAPGHRHEAQAPRGMTRTIAFERLPAVFDDFIKGKAKGRIVVDRLAA